MLVTFHTLIQPRRSTLTRECFKFGWPISTTSFAVSFNRLRHVTIGILNRLFFSGSCVSVIGEYFLVASLDTVTFFDVLDLLLLLPKG